LEQALAEDEASPPPKAAVRAAPAKASAARIPDDEDGAFPAPSTGPKGNPAALAGVENAADLPGPEPLTSAAEKEAGPIIDLFGTYVAQCYYSKSWNLREAAVSKMAIELPTVVGNNSAAAVFSACIAIMVSITAKDKIAHVFSAAMSKLLPSLLESCTSGMRRADMSTSLEVLVAGLVDKLGENTPRVREAAMTALTLLAQKEYGGPAFVASNILRKMNKKQASSIRSLQSRLEMLIELTEKANVITDPSSGVTPAVLVSYW
jgi:hypothetical protein